MYYDEYYEEDRLASPSDAMREYAYNVGYNDRYKDSQWILTDYDVWVVNPHYCGKPQPHPEEVEYMTNEEIESYGDRVIAQREFIGPPSPAPDYNDDDIPF